MIVGISGKIGSGKDTVGSFLQYLYECNSYKETTITPSYKGYLEWVEIKPVRDVTSFRIKKFADKLKDMVCILINCTREQLEDHKFKNTVLGEEWWQYKYLLHKKKGDGTVPIKNIKTEEVEWKFITKEFYESLSSLEKDYHSAHIVKLTPRKLLQLLGTDCGRNIIHPNIWVNSTLSKYNKDVDTYIITDTRFIEEAESIKSKKGFLIRVNRDKEIFYEFDVDNNQHIVYDIEDKTHNLSYFNADSYSEEEAIQEFKTMLLEAEHESEKDLDNYAHFDMIIDNNSSIEILFEKVKTVFNICLKPI